MAFFVLRPHTYLRAIWRRGNMVIEIISRGFERNLTSWFAISKNVCAWGGADGCRRETMRGWAAWCAREGCSFWFYGACINANLLLRCCTIVSSFLPNERLITGPRAVHGCIIVFRQVDPPAAAALIVIGGLHEGWTVRSAINRI